jgi:hypothetical protein
MYFLTLGDKKIIFSFGVDHLGSCIFALSKAGSFKQEDTVECILTELVDVFEGRST